MFTDIIFNAKLAVKECQSYIYIFELSHSFGQYIDLYLSISFRIQPTIMDVAMPLLS